MKTKDLQSIFLQIPTPQSKHRKDVVTIKGSAEGSTPEHTACVKLMNKCIGADYFWKVDGCYERYNHALNRKGLECEKKTNET